MTGLSAFSKNDGGMKRTSCSREIDRIDDGPAYIQATGLAQLGAQS
jgi:hypothetical protein